MTDEEKIEYDIIKKHYVYGTPLNIKKEECIRILLLHDCSLSLESAELLRYELAWNRLKERNLLLRTPDMRLLTHEMEKQEQIFNLRSHKERIIEEMKDKGENYARDNKNIR